MDPLDPRTRQTLPRPRGHPPPSSREGWLTIPAAKVTPRSGRGGAPEVSDPAHLHRSAGGTYYPN